MTPAEARARLPAARAAVADLRRAGKSAFAAVAAQHVEKLQAIATGRRPMPSGHRAEIVHFRPAPPR